jgi:polysaccharide export outer membrane protein
MHRYISSGLIGLLFVCILTAQKQEAVPKDLKEYVRQARKAGLADSQIKLNAMRVGWAPENLDVALELPGGAPAAKPDAAEPRKPAPKESGFRGSPRAGLPPQQRSSRPSPPAAAIKATGPSRAVNEPVADGAAPAASPKTAADDEYLIGAGDVVQVSVWGEQSASVPSAVVRPDGKISIPLLKEFAISGLTPTQAGRTIAEQLDQFIKGANVTVVVSQINSKKIYLLGAVKKEGTISYTYRMTVMQALSEAGGLTDYAKRKKIYVIPIGGKKEDRLPFDYDAVVKGEHMELNITLEPGDTIVVPH